MANLVASAIAFACMGAQGNYNQACNKALDAGTRQVGVRQQVDFVEDGTANYLTNMAKAQITKRLTDRQSTLLGAGFFVYKTAKDQKINFNLPTLGVCNSINNELTPSSYSINFVWSLR